MVNVLEVHSRTYWIIVKPSMSTSFFCYMTSVVVEPVMMHVLWIFYEECTPYRTTNYDIYHRPYSSAELKSRP